MLNQRIKREGLCIAGSFHTWLLVPVTGKGKLAPALVTMESEWELFVKACNSLSEEELSVVCDIRPPKNTWFQEMVLFKLEININILYKLVSIGVSSPS